MSRNSKISEQRHEEIKSLIEKIDNRLLQIRFGLSNQDTKKDERMGIGLFSSNIKEAVEKQIPQLVKRGVTRTSGAQIMVEHHCPRCGQYLAGIVLKSYCDNCGQKLDWGEMKL